MAKCPKCDKKYVTTSLTTHCAQCGRLKSYYDKLYQQRLDKVLSKFSGLPKNKEFVFKDGYGKKVGTIWWRDKFVLLNESDMWMADLSLETVESLIKDLEIR